MFFDQLLEAVFANVLNRARNRGMNLRKHTHANGKRPYSKSKRLQNSDGLFVVVKPFVYLSLGNVLQSTSLIHDCPDDVFKSHLLSPSFRADRSPPNH